MNVRLIAAAFFAGLFILSAVKTAAQEKINFKLNHPVSLTRDDSFLSLTNKFTASPETVRVLAVMVDFLEDNDTRTSGNGKFDLSPPDSIIDSPPHNKEYFESHLQFLENYWHRTTNGKLIVKSKLLDSVYHLPNQMQYYSPPKNSTTFSEIGSLINDTWRKVDSLNSNFPFNEYDAFCIFHSGVGRDIDLVSVFGYDPTPFDIPSIYLGLNNLKKNFGNNYEGVPVSNNQFIKNSMVLPSTENRKFQTIAGTTLLQLGINGLMVGTFGSHLGLPDLFNTKTGKSAIGRFGLMDGQSMFSWSGLFPPELSAWEKYFLDKKYNLGMLRIIDAKPGENVADIPAVGLTDIDTIYRVEINAKEYFLIENRNRDAFRNGINVTLRYNGETIQKHFARDTTRFNAFDQRAIYGVVTDIDELDWSLPGGVGKDNTFYDGGMLIWHIDENIIEQNFSTNTINADVRRRGVDLEEADGSQDIGQSYGFLSPGSGSEDGTIFDFWYSGNTAPVYKNEFGPSTHPSTMSNDFASSHITIKDFTERSPRMSAKIILGNDIVKPLPGFPKFIGANAVKHAPQIIDGRIFISKGDSVFVFLADGRSATINPNGLFSEVGGKFPITIDGNSNFFGVNENILYKIKTYDVNNDSIFELIEITDTVSFNAEITTTPVNVVTDNSSFVFVGCQNGFVYDNTNSEFKVGNGKISSLSYFFKSPNLHRPFLLIGTSADSISMNDITIKSALPYLSENWEAVSAGESGNQAYYFAVADIGGQSLLLLDSELKLIRQITINEGKIAGIAVSDLDNDGSRDVIVTSGRKIYAYNHNGFLLDYYPITVSDTITSPPIIADIDANGKLDVLVSTKNNLIAAYSSNGKSLFGFPISVSSGSVSTMSISGNPGILTAISGDGYLYAWSLANVNSITWGNYKGNFYHTASDNSPLIGKPPTTEFFPSSRAYNWPNPVYDSKTNIRFFVSEDASVTIKIFDMAGDIVDELKTNAVGNIDNEIEWNAANVQSGIYYAHIKAEGKNNNGISIIKIAVVK